MSGTPQAFLSYTRLDDQGHDGGITALRAALELQVRIVTGDDSFEIFQDVDGIAFGEHWPRKLDQALAASRFLAHEQPARTTSPSRSLWSMRQCWNVRR